MAMDKIAIPNFFAPIVNDSLSLFEMIGAILFYETHSPIPAR